MSAKLHPIFDFITKPLSEPDPMGPLKTFYANALAEKVAQRSAQRRKLHQTIENMLVEQRPDFIDATELLSALRAGLEARLESHGDDLPIEVGYAFDDLKKAMDASAPHEIDAYDPSGDDDQE